MVNFIPDLKKQSQHLPQLTTPGTPGEDNPGHTCPGPPQHWTLWTLVSYRSLQRYRVSAEMTFLFSSLLPSFLPQSLFIGCFLCSQCSSPDLREIPSCHFQFNTTSSSKPSVTTQPIESHCCLYYIALLSHLNFICLFTAIFLKIFHKQQSHNNVAECKSWKTLSRLKTLVSGQ